MRALHWLASARTGPLAQDLPALTGPNQQYLERLKLLHDALAGPSAALLRQRVLAGAPHLAHESATLSLTALPVRSAAHAGGQIVRVHQQIPPSRTLNPEG